MACDLYREGTLLRCGKMRLTMLNFDLVGAVPVFVQFFAGQRCNLSLNLKDECAVRRTTN